jgi:23S rRNA (cytidine1920-2'-O)/16S rRNA (cytidine1409-2'-O)-methyltransferase
VTVLERTNLRHLDPDSLPTIVEAAVADLSFISLTLVLPKLAAIVPHKGWLIPLVKPQFEVDRHEVGKGGVVRDAKKISAAVEKVKVSAESIGFVVKGQMDSPIKGPKGNQEVFLHLVRR